MLTLKAEPRAVFGKKLRASREAGKMPAVLYGGKENPAALFVSAHDFKKVLKAAGESSLVVLETDTGKKEVLIHEIARHPVSAEPLHADFYLIDKTKAIKVTVPLRFIGVPPALKLGGTLIKVRYELEIESLPQTIPPELIVDVSQLVDLESQILVKDIVLPPGVRALNQPNEVAVAISAAEEEPVSEEPVDLSKIEVEKKGKKEEAPAEPPAGDDGPAPA